jgi:DNA-binding FadR family transcriptional regulator
MASYRDIAITAEQLEPIQRETVMSMVARRIEQLVRSGELKAGDRLPPEPDLAQMLRVSRGSLREALKGLMYLGLIKSRAGDGTYIQSSLSRVLNQHFQWMILLDEVKHLEIYELRKIIEPDAAALAAERATRADIDSLEAALDGMAEARPVSRVRYSVSRCARPGVGQRRHTNHDAHAVSRNIRGSKGSVAIYR